MSQTSHIYQGPRDKDKVTLDIDFADNPVFQYDVKVVKNPFVDDGDIYIWLQKTFNVKT